MGKSQSLDSNDVLQNHRSLREDERTAIAEALSPMIFSKADRTSISQTAQRTAVLQTRVKLVDLNHDGKPEIIAQASGDDWCSPTGNCSFWILQRAGARYKVILNGHSAQDFSLQRTSTNGFRDVVLEMHGSATQQELFLYSTEPGAIGKQQVSIQTGHGR